MAWITRINRFPVKALSSESLDRMTLTAGYGLPFDRRFALAHGKPDRATPSDGWPWQPPDRFLTLKRYERLAALTLRFDDRTGRAAISNNSTSEPEIVEADILSDEGRELISRFVEAFLDDPTSDGKHLAVKLVDAGTGGHLTDRQTPFVSVINQASVDAIRPDATAGAGPLDPTRFRGNLIVDGWEPWVEASLIGRHLWVGKTRLHVVEPIGRCVATHVNPATAQRDRNILKSLKAQFGHTECGVYAIVVEGGDISAGDTIKPE